MKKLSTIIIFGALFGWMILSLISMTIYTNKVEDLEKDVAHYKDKAETYEHYYNELDKTHQDLKGEFDRLANASQLVVEEFDKYVKEQENSPNQ